MLFIFRYDIIIRPLFCGRRMLILSIFMLTCSLLIICFDFALCSFCILCSFLSIYLAVGSGNHPPPAAGAVQIDQLARLGGSG